MKTNATRSLALAGALLASPWIAGATTPPGRQCADIRLRAAATASEAILTCHRRADSCREPDQSCLRPAERRFRRDMSRADRFECFGVDPDVNQLWSELVQSAADIALQVCDPISLCGRSGLQCGGACNTGFLCRAVGDGCECLPEKFDCEGGPQSTCGGFHQAGFCPGLDQSCDPETCDCVDAAPTENCGDSGPDASGQCTGDAAPGLTCLTLYGFCSAWPASYDCEAEHGYCSEGGSFGLCPNVNQHCNLETCECE